MENLRIQIIINHSLSKILIECYMARCFYKKESDFTMPRRSIGARGCMPKYFASNNHVIKSI